VTCIVFSASLSPFVEVRPGSLPLLAADAPRDRGSEQRDFSRFASHVNCGPAPETDMDATKARNTRNGRVRRKSASFLPASCFRGSQYRVWGRKERLTAHSSLLTSSVVSGVGLG
jgi:hypothetical protein